MPTVLQINECLDVATGSIARQIGETALRLGWNSYIVYSARERYHSTECKTFTIGSTSDFYLHALETRLFDNHGLASRNATKLLVKRIAKLNPDIIHLHNVHGYYLNYKILFEFLTKANIPVVWTLHDCWTFTGHCSHFESIGCLKWKEKCERCSLKREYPKTWIIDKSGRNYELKKSLFTSVKNMTLVPVSWWLSKFISDSFLKKYPIRVINNGIDLRIFRPSEVHTQFIERKKNKIYVLGVANTWTRQKGFYEFLKLGGDNRFQVILVGFIPKKDILSKNIIAMGYINDPTELAKIYSSVDVFVNPTYADTFPTVIIESIACGTPVVAYRTGGCPEIVDEEIGYIAEQGNYQDLLNGILQIATQSVNSKLRQKHLCRERATLRYNKDERFQEYIELYNSLIQSKSH